MILGQITLKYNLSLFIFSFATINPGLHYVSKKSILIEHGYLDWRGFSLRNFCNQQGCCLFFDKPFTCSEWIFKCIIGQSKNEKRKEKHDSRVKTRKGQSRVKIRNFWRLTSKTNRKIKRQQPNGAQSIYEVLNPFQNR